MSDIREKTTMAKVVAAYNSMGYKFHETGDYNVNIFGIRSNDMHSNKFNDVVGVIFKIGGDWQFRTYDATTDPGTYYRKNLLNSKGVAILVPGQYKGAYQIGLHQGKYTALRQAKSVTVWRDNDRDNEIDTANMKKDTGLFGINIHRASSSGTSIQVDRWSAGCQVIASSADFSDFMSVCQKSKTKYGNGFTYTLFTENQVFSQSTSEGPPPIITNDEAKVLDEISPSVVVPSPSVSFDQGTFEFALKAIKENKRVSRKSWTTNNGPVWVSLCIPNMDKAAMTFLMETSSVNIVGWQPDVMDILATDWFVE